jgi:hypothetical protein
MARPTKAERFILSKCDRCGKATAPNQNGLGDLYVLPEEYGEPLADEGSFCLTCLVSFGKENWLEWFKRTGRLIENGSK